MRQAILRAIGATIHWLVVSSVFGFLQVGLLMMIVYALPGGQFEFESILRDGVLIFFSTAIVSAALVEYFFDEIPEISRTVRSIVGTFPTVMAVGSIGLYSILFFQREAVPADRLVELEGFVMLACMAFAGFLKYYCFAYRFSRQRGRSS